MQPNTRADQYKPKWRHFHPQATVWVQNPFDDDVVFQVADEYNNAYQYRLPAGKVSELPGGMIATLGVKEIVDRLIMNDKDDVLRIWEAAVREKHEAKVILRVKEAPLTTGSRQPDGIVDLSVTNKTDEPELDITTPEVAKPVQQEQAFPNLKRGKAKSAVSDIAAASVGKKDQIVETD